MRGFLTRLATDEAPWFARALVRLAGLCLLAASYLIVGLCERLEHFERQHQPTPLEFGVAALAVVTLSLGIALSIEGARLFRLQPSPPRPWVPMNKEKP